MNHRIYFLVALLSIFIAPGVFAAGEIEYGVDPATGAITSLKIAGDPHSMEWLTATDGSQYPWVEKGYGWGLGFFTAGSEKARWETPDTIIGNCAAYSAKGVAVTVCRSLSDGNLHEEYVFKNISDKKLSLSEIGIFTPFNDNYPDAATCLTNRTNVHIWNGDNAAYINATRMGGAAPHLGLAVTDGSIKGYEIFERGLNRQNSQQRGVFALKLPDMELMPGESYTLGWTIFSHQGSADFAQKAAALGTPMLYSDSYVYCVGDTAVVKARTADNRALFRLDGKSYSPKREGQDLAARIPIAKAGHNRVDFEYGDGKRTRIELLAIPSFDSLLEARANFIVHRQQMPNPADARFGAYMVYDNEGDTIYSNNWGNCNPPDRDEGRERVGMGVMLAKYCQLHPSDELKESLMKYYDYLRYRLQDDQYNTFSTVNHKCENRGYNYPWVANFYFQMYKITKDKKYALDGYDTMQALFRNFGHGFYCIEMPVLLGLEALKDAELDDEYGQLLEDYRQTGDIFAANSVNYPKHEVNYEQSIVAPAINFLLQIYQATGDEKYLIEAKKQLPVLEAFNGSQPSYHLNDIAVRHWDDYWFGKSEMFGDTFPHYWSAGTGAVFYFYSQITGDEDYMRRARNIINNNLCLFSPDGRGYCAYVYPEKIDGRPGEFYDQFANDQDWALVYYLLINHGLH